MSDITGKLGLRRTPKIDAAPPPIPRREPLSQRAAAVRQQIEELEQSLEDCREHIEALERRTRLAEDETVRLREQLHTANKDRDYYLEKWIITKTRLNNSAAIILEAIKDDDSIASSYRPSPQAMKAFETAVSGVKEDGNEPIPSFLAKELPAASAP